MTSIRKAKKSWKSQYPFDTKGLWQKSADSHTSKETTDNGMSNDLGMAHKLSVVPRGYTDEHGLENII